ncbi:hypothetical protein [Aeromonas phage PVN02]|nr:hypothetical protein [Aeromonas phage PVN02]CAC9972303.1 hypothetical protein PVN02_00036 [Aeromonas phage PVN02]
MPYLSTHPRRGFRCGDVVAHVGPNSSVRGQRGRVTRVYTRSNEVKIDIQWEQRKDVMTYSFTWACLHIGISISSLAHDDNRFNGRRYVAKYAEFAKPLEWIKREPYDRSLATHDEMKKIVDRRVVDLPQSNVPVDDGMLYRLGLLMHGKPAFPCRIMRDTDKAVFNVPSLEELGRLPRGMYTILNGEAPKQEQKPEPKLDTKPVPEFPYMVLSLSTHRAVEITCQEELENLADGEYEVYTKTSALSIKPVKKSTISFS